MELLLLRAGLREDERTSIARFLSGLNMEVRDKVELLPYRDLDELVQRVEQQLTKNFIRDVTPMPHNGCRSPKKRRV